ncbi:MAG: Tol-Pal system protein TolB, partial [Pseudomonadales bacterium]|nr:Tol-Pal system protein TolB [Pseudomonadales bacterium]
MFMKSRSRCSGNFLKTPVIACLVLFLTASLGARAELLIRITEGAGSAIPIAVVPFAESGSMPAGDKVGSIVQADLTMSGEFRPL